MRNLWILNIEGSSAQKAVVLLVVCVRKSLYTRDASVYVFSPTVLCSAVAVTAALKCCFMCYKSPVVYMELDANSCKSICVQN